MALRKLCNHPDLVTNDHSVQVTPWKTKKAKAKRRKGKEEEEEEGEESRLLLGTLHYNNAIYTPYLRGPRIGEPFPTQRKLR